MGCKSICGKQEMGSKAIHIFIGKRIYQILEPIA
jgi:hypothetical protein